MALLTVDDVLLFSPGEDRGQVAALVAGVLARATLAVPGLQAEGDLSQAQKDAVKDILRAAVLRSIEAGWSGGATVTQSAPAGYSQTIQTRARKGVLYDSELDELRQIVGVTETTERQKAFVLSSTVDAVRGHEPGCGVFFGAACSCLLGYPPVARAPFPDPFAR